MQQLLESIADRPIPILDIAIAAYCPLDLSMHNSQLKNVDVTNANDCQAYIDEILQENGAEVAFGGYLEKRNLYASASRFSGNEERNIHLGVDFWAKTNTPVLAPIEGVVHSFKDNNDFGNYGPTIILEHQIQGTRFYTLYGHLSKASIANIYKGKLIKMGQVFSHLGATEINVGYAPHLHFQIIIDLQGFEGDYPGVCSKNDIDFYIENCPNPNFLLGL